MRMKKNVALISTLLPALVVAQNSEPAEPSPVPAAEAEPAAPAPKLEKPKGAPVEQSWGDGSLGLLLQSWFWASTDPRFLAGYTNSYSGEPNAGSWSFRLRRAEVSLDGKVAGHVKYRVMVDPSIIQNGPVTVKSTGTVTGSTATVNGTATVKDILQDAWVGTLVPYHEVRLGQMKVPLTMEGFNSSGKLDFAERAIVTRTFGDQRDIGLMVLSDKVPFVEYEAGLFNGTGKNVYDNSPHKIGVFRAVAKPIPEVSAGGSVQFAQVYSSTAGRTLHKNRAGLEVALEKYGAKLSAEYMRGVEGAFNTSSKALSTLTPAGYYVTLGYRIRPELQGVVRWEHFDSDTSVDTDTCKAAGSSPLPGGSCNKVRVISIGINYDVAPELLHGAKLQLDYLNTRDEVAELSVNEIFLVAQVKF